MLFFRNLSQISFVLLCSLVGQAQLPPTIIIEPVEFVEDQLRSVTSIQITVEGSLPLSYQWFKYDGFDFWAGILLRPIRGATNVTFAPNSVAGATPYLCIVTNTWGAVTSRVSTISAPMWLALEEVGSWPEPGARPRGVLEIAYTNQLAYACVTTGAVAVISFAEPSLPKLVSEFITVGPPSDIEVENGIAFVTCGKAGLEAIDFRNLANPVRRSVLRLPVTADFLKVENGIAYVGSFQRGWIQLVNVTNPDLPRTNGVLLALSADSIAVENGLLAARSDGGIRIADVSNPDSPSWVGIFPISDYGIVFGLRNNLVYVAGTIKYMLSITNPASPTGFNGGFGVRSWSSLTETMIVTPEHAYDVTTPEQVALINTGPPGIRSVVEAGNFLVGANRFGVSIMEIQTGPPRIVSSSENIEVTLAPGNRNDGFLSVSARGAAPLYYQWYFGESGDTCVPLALQTGSQFSWTPWLTSLSTQQFWVRVFNRYGEAHCTTFTVSVRPSVSLQFSQAGAELLLTALPGSTWILEGSPDLSRWSILAEGLQLSSNALQLGVPIAAPDSGHQFFRLREAGH